MPPSIDQLPGPDTLPGLLLTMTALSGEMPYALIRRLPGSDSYKTAAVKKLKQQKLLRTFYRDSLRGLRLTAAAKRLLLTTRPGCFLPYLSGKTETNTLKSEITRRLRLHRMAEVLVTMVNADISSFPWKKPAVFQPTPLPVEPHFDRPAYYSSREVKEIGPQSTKIRGSRSTGVLLTDDGIFVVYNTASSQTKWEYKAELRFKALLQMEVCQSRLNEQYRDAEVDALVFGDSMEQMEHLMGPGDSRTHNYFILDGSFTHFYYLTNDHHGEVVLRLLCDKELKAVLDEILSDDLFPGRPDWPIENDAIDEADSPVLFAYTCDMPRIRRFDTALNLHGKTGTLYCFDFQEEVLRQVCGPQVVFQSIDFDAFERGVLNTTQKSD